jgi:hypothetical protein
VAVAPSLAVAGDGGLSWWQQLIVAMEGTGMLDLEISELRSID